MPLPTWPRRALPWPRRTFWVLCFCPSELRQHVQHCVVGASACKTRHCTVGHRHGRVCGHCTLGARRLRWVLVKWEEWLFELLAMELVAVVVVAVAVAVVVAEAVESDRRRYWACRYF